MHDKRVIRIQKHNSEIFFLQLTRNITKYFFLMFQIQHQICCFGADTYETSLQKDILNKRILMRTAIFQFFYPHFLL